MFKRIVAALIAFIVVVAVCEAIGLVLLKHSIVTHRNYWDTRASGQGELLYVALGDSTAQAVGSNDPALGYVGRLADAITNATGRKVRVVNLSVSGATVQDVLEEQVPQLDAIASSASKPYLVTVSVGANDVVHGEQSNAAFRAGFEKIMQALPPEQSVVADVPYFGGRIRAGEQVQQANSVIYKLAGQYSIPVAPLYDQLKPRQSPWIYASDLFHPNHRAYAIWYEAFWQKVRPIIDAGQYPQPRPAVTDQPMPLPPTR